jgi:tRNA threonylcarbamoyladenosine biosynthesis protein TsaE
LPPEIAAHNDACEFIATDEAQTERLGTALGEALEPGTVVALVGELGAGKTRLVQAIVTALGVDRRDVSSPTFVLIQEYAARLPVYHFDAYRLRDIDEFLELGADELLGSGGVCLIEWADRVAEVLPRDRLQITIEIQSETARRFRLQSSGRVSHAVLERVRNAVGVA